MPRSSDERLEPQKGPDHERLAAIVESSFDAIISKDLDGIVTSWNPAATAVFGYTAEEMIGQPITRLIPTDRLNEEALIIERIRRGERAEFLETVRCRKDGRKIDVSITISPIRDSSGAIVGASKIARDISRQKEREREIERLNAMYAALSQINQAIVWSTERRELFDRVCRVLVEHGGFRFACIGWQESDAHSVVPTAWSGEAAGVVDLIHAHVGEAPLEASPAGSAFRSGAPCVDNDLLEDSPSADWKPLLAAHGIRSTASLPIRMGGVVCGLLSVCSERAWFFQAREMALLEEAVMDMSFALDNFSREEARRGAEGRLRTEKSFSDSVIESMPGVVYLYDLRGQFLRWNRNVETVTGYSAAEIAKMSPVDFFPDEEKALLRARIAEALAVGESQVEAKLRTKGGALLPYYFTGRRVVMDGVVYLAGVGIDISERRRAESERDLRHRAEAKLLEQATLLDKAQDAILVRDLEHRITYWNKSAEALYGWPASEVMGRSARELLYVEPAQFDEAMRRALVEGEFVGELSQRRRDGRRLTVEGRWTLVRDDAGEPRAVFAINTDVSERKRLEEQLRQSQKMEAVGQFAGGVAHDFNNLLTVIVGCSEHLAGLQGLDPAAQESVLAIRETSDRAADLTRKLLSFSRRSILQPKVLDLNAVVAGTAELLRRIIGDDVQLVTVLDPHIGRVKADPTQLDQVLMNLAANARDAMPDGGKLSVETSVAVLDEEHASSHPGCRRGPHVRLSVTDTGHGMGTDVLAHIFEPFYTTKESSKGTGLGLATVYGIVQQSGGCIHVRSEPGQGARFDIHLPVVDEPAGETVTRSAPVETTGHETILLVEDDEQVRRLVAQSLRKQGYTVLPATDGLNALEVLADGDARIDLLLTDVMMPNLSGAELARRIGARFPSVKVLFMSGYTDDAVLRHGLIEERVAFIQKPYTPSQLARKIREVLRGTRGD